MDPKLRKRLFTGVLVGLPLLSLGRRALGSLLSKEPSTCPKCSYRMVEVVGRRSYPNAAAPKGKERITFLECGCCHAQYKRVEEGPLCTPTEEEWEGARRR